MKKLTALLLISLMVLALTACGGNADGGNATEPATDEIAVSTMSKDEMLAQAVEADVNDINNDSFENLVRAKMTYCNKVLKVSGMVQSIKEDHIVMGVNSTYGLAVYLPLEEIVLLEVGQHIAVVGQTTDELVNNTENIGGYTFDYSDYQMPSAYLVQDRFEYTGILKGENTSYAPAFNIQIGDSNYLRLIYFADSVDTSTLQFAQEIKFTAKCVKGSLNWEYYEAEIIE